MVKVGLNMEKIKSSSFYVEGEHDDANLLVTTHFITLKQKSDTMVTRKREKKPKVAIMALQKDRDLSIFLIKER